MPRHLKIMPMLLVLMALVVGCFSSAGQRATPTPLPTPRSPSSSGSQSTLTVPPTPSRVGESFSFQVMDVAFVDATHGWALGLYRSGYTLGQVAMRATSDGGRTWRAIPAPETESSLGTPSVRKIRFANLREGWAFDPGLFSTQDGGLTWTNETRESPVISVVPVAETVWAIERGCLAVPPYTCESTLLIGTKKQPAWVPAATRLPADVQQVIRVNTNEAWMLSQPEPFKPESSNTTYFRNRIFVTHDGGLAWNEPGAPPTTSDCGFIAKDDSGQLWLLCGSSPATDMQIKFLFISKDEGGHWTKIADVIPTPLGSGMNNLPIIGIIWDFAVVSKDRAFIALVDSGVIATSDGGRTWKDPIGFPDANAMGGFTRVLFVDQWHGWATPGQDIVFRTEDSGLVWEEERIP